MYGFLVKQVAGPKAGECETTGCDAFDYLQKAGARRLPTTRAAQEEDDADDDGFRYVDRIGRRVRPHICLSQNTTINC